MHMLSFDNLKASYYFLLAFGLFIVALYAFLARKKALRQFADSDSLPYLLVSEKRTTVRMFLLLVSFCLATLALMDPYRKNPVHLKSELDKEILEEEVQEGENSEPLLRKRSLCEVIFLVDVSASMDIADTRTQATRLEYAKEIVEEMISHLDGQNVALYAFTSQVTPVVPPTLDYIFTRMMTRALQVNEGDVAGTDLQEALEYLKRKHFKSPKAKQSVVVLLTDGGDTYLETLQGSERQDQIQMMISQLKAHENQSVKCFSIGLGTQSGQEVPGILYEGKPVISSLDEELLSKLSAQTGGHLFLADQHSSLQMAESIVQQIKKEEESLEEEITSSKKLLRASLDTSDDSLGKIYYGQWPLFLALLALAYEILMPFLVSKEQVLIDE